MKDQPEVVNRVFLDAVSILLGIFVFGCITIDCDETVDPGTNRVRHICTFCDQDSDCLPNEQCETVYLEGGGTADVCVDPEEDVAAWYCDVTRNEDW